MIPGYDPIDLTFLDASERAYGPCTVDSDLAHALVTETDEWLIIAFQGTEPKRLIDDLTDISAIPVNIPGIGQFHEAFWRSTCSVSWMLVLRVATAKKSGKKIGVTGHSKGGAEAQCFTVQLHLLGMAPDRLTVFEAARALSSAPMAMICATPGLSLRNGPDQVPNMPKWFSELPVTQLGDPLEDLLPERWIPYHLLSSVRPAFLAAI